MAAQQPNFVQLSSSLMTASAQIALIPNVPPIAVQGQLEEIILRLRLEQMQNQMSNGQNNMHNQLNIMHNQLNNMRDQFVERFHNIE